MVRMWGMMPVLADYIPWAPEYDVGVQVDWDEDMDEEVQSGIWAFCCPTRVLEWVGKLPTKGRCGFPRALDMM